MNGKRWEAFAVERSVQQDCVLSPLLHFLTLEQFQPCTAFLLLSAKVSAYVDDITVLVSRYLDMKVVKKAVARYELIARTKINFDKSEDLQVGAWRVMFPSQGISAGPICILGVWFEPRLQLEQIWSEVQAKVNPQVDPFF